MITHADITAERITSGGILCTTMAHGRLVSERYYGYTMREARAAFRRYVNSLRA